MKDLFDMFMEEDYSRVKWDKDQLVPTDDIVDYDDIDDLMELEIPEEESHDE